MPMRPVRFSAAFVCALLFGCATPALMDGPESISICAINESSPELSGKYVKVTANIDDNFRHYIGLTDPNCPGSYIALSKRGAVPGKFNPEPLGYDALNKAVVDVMVMKGRDVRVTVTGWLTFWPEGKKSYALAPDKYEDVKIIQTGRTN